MFKNGDKVVINESVKGTGLEKFYGLPGEICSIRTYDICPYGVKFYMDEVEFFQERMISKSFLDIDFEKKVIYSFVVTIKGEKFELSQKEFKALATRCQEINEKIALDEAW